MTLIELLIYVAMVTLVVGAMVQFGWNLIYAQTKAEVHREVEANLLLASKRLAYEIKNASAIIQLSDSSVCLTTATALPNPVRFYLSSGRLLLGTGGNCTTSATSYPLTSNLVQATAFSLTNLSVEPSSSNIRFSLTLRYASQSARQEYQKTASYTSSSELRSK